MRFLWRILDVVHALVALLCFPLRFTAWGKERVAFESKRGAPLEKADWTFEISSEGEFEQVRPWLEIILSRGEYVELVYSSPSVARTVEALAKRFTGRVRLFPLPLLTHTPWVLVQELRAPKMVLCRYDFFPSVMSRATVSNVTAGVVWASFIRKRNRLKRGFWRYYYRFFYNVFKWVVPATLDDEELYQRLGTLTVLPTCEMRVPQIEQRLAAKEQTLKLKFPHWSVFESYLESFPREKRWMLGSFWEQDLEFLRNPQLQEEVKDGRACIVLVPHKLSPQWVAKVASFGLTVNHIDENWDGTFNRGVNLLNLKGVLCELYAYTGFAYVGGGFGRSIHSVMEPYVAEAQVVCGPRVHRSTEAEKIYNISPKHIVVVPSLAELTKVYSKLELQTEGQVKRREWIDNQLQRLQDNLTQVEKIC